MPLPTASSSTLLLTSFTRVSQNRCSRLGRLKFCCDGVVVCKRKSDAAVRVQTVALGTYTVSPTMLLKSHRPVWFFFSRFLPVVT